MVQGVVKWFDSRKGYGFITTEEEQDVFVHYTAIIAENENEFLTLYEGDEVEFNITEGKKGPQANDVKIIKRSPQSQRYRR